MSLVRKNIDYIFGGLNHKFVPAFRDYNNEDVMTKTLYRSMYYKIQVNDMHTNLITE